MRAITLRAAAACLTAIVALLTRANVRAADADEVVAVYSAVSPDYHRVKTADGSFQPESYAFGEGGPAAGDRRDASFDKLHFLDIAHVIAPALTTQNYTPCDTSDPHHTNLLIMVYWGTTIGTDRSSSGAEYQIAQSLIPPPRAPMSPPPTGGNAAMVSDPSTSGRGAEGAILAAQRAADESALAQSTLISQLANRQRDRQDRENASVLGFLPELQQVEAYRNTPLGQRQKDILDEIEESRYYVVLLAYDFQTLLRDKQRKLLWETRFSIRERHSDFSKQLAAMAQSASRYFGQDSGGLVRKPLPAVRVEMGELKSLGPERDR